MTTNTNVVAATADNDAKFKNTCNALSTLICNRATNFQIREYAVLNRLVRKKAT